MNKAPPCIVCQSDESRAMYGNLLRRCQVCGFVTASLDASTVDFSDIYGTEYFKGEEYLNYTLDKHVIQTNFRRRLARVFRFLPSDSMKAVLEIGCAYGFFGEVLRQEVPACSYVGYDIASEAVRHASVGLGLDARCQNYLESDEASEQFTDCFMWDVIEHLPRPDRIIKKIHGDLKPGGRLLITTGDIDRLLPRLQGPNWRMIHPPTHLHYFSRSTLSLMLESCGFKVCQVTYPSICRSVRLIFYSLLILRKKPSLISQSLYRFIPESLSLSMNTFDVMFMIATRK